MKIGDKVRFLSETGGGIVAGFQGKNIVLVEDEDGFEIPTPINEVVVVETDDYNIARVHTSAVPGMQRPKTTEKPVKNDDEEDDPADRPITFKAPVEERKGGDVLTAFLAFVPIDIKQMTTTAFESYFVNDSNYFMRFTYLVAEGNSWRMKCTAEVEPNTKLFIEEFTKAQLNDMERSCMQILAYKRGKSFVIKPSVDVQFRVDPVKFYKLHTFQENDFFETPALLIPLVENDVPRRPLVVDAQSLKKEMYASRPAAEKPQGRGDTLLRRYDDAQSKGKAQQRKTDPNIVVVDLHASEVLETTAGMAPVDILNYQLGIFRQTLEQYKAKKGQKIVFIHGKGEGVLRRAIISELNYRYKKYTFQDASFQEYGYGATQVTIR
ncbi:MAG: DUF2027 domain-containing protein [Prevotella sp.]|nr:DUF2027 domain-containing protein [Prevotella sp.]